MALRRGAKLGPLPKDSGQGCCSLLGLGTYWGAELQPKEAGGQASSPPSSLSGAEIERARAARVVLGGGLLWLPVGTEASVEDPPCLPPQLPCGAAGQGALTSRSLHWEQPDDEAVWGARGVLETEVPR